MQSVAGNADFGGRLLDGLNHWHQVFFAVFAHREDDARLLAVGADERVAQAINRLGQRQIDRRTGQPVDQVGARQGWCEIGGRGKRT